MDTLETLYTKNVRRASTLIGVLFIFCAGLYVGYSQRPEVENVVSLTNTDTAVSTTVDFASFWKVWNLINEKYVAGDKPTDEEKLWGAISGLVGSLEDPYSIFLPPEDKKAFEEEISGEFQGVGMEIAIREKVLTVVAPLKNTPAERAGVKSGDKVLKIDNTVSVDLSVEEAVKLIRGPKGTAVKLTIQRGTEVSPREISIVRDVISIPTLDIEIWNIETKKKVEGAGSTEDAFVIRLYNFSAQSPFLFREALRQFAISGKSRLVIDLRGNPGGYLEAAVDMASWFLPMGKAVVREDFGNNEERVYRSKGYNAFSDALKMSILVNEGSASASEILAGALNEHKKGKLVGAKTFGKGSVQELVPVTGDTSLKITIARWLTPNGVSISEQGLTPEFIVENKAVDVEKGIDAQMEKALEIIK